MSDVVLDDTIDVKSDEGTQQTKTSELESTQIIGADEYNIVDDAEQPKNDDNDFQAQELNEENAYFTISSCYIKEIRLIKKEIEELLWKKVKNLEFDLSSKEKQRKVSYFKHFSIDRIGAQVIHAETGIAEGWNVPKYANEFQNLLGLPFTEDNALGETLRIKRPHMECFNCLSLSHRVSDCPIKIDEERMRLHRQLFNTQSQQAQDQAQLYSTRYTGSGASKISRPGQVSAQLREALGIRENQLPAYVYRMREYGYPIGWLLEARVDKSVKLAVHDGQVPSGNDIAGQDAKSSNNQDNEPVEYDPEKIYTFVGFNELPPKGTIDESDKYGVRRYGTDLSKERFLATLNLKKRKIVRRSTIATPKNLKMTSDKDTVIDISNEDDSSAMVTKNGAKKEQTREQLNENSIICLDDDENGDVEIEESGEPETDGESDTASNGGKCNESSTFDSDSPQKKKRWVNEKEVSILGTSLIEIPGTPILRNVTEVDHVPASEKFSANICEHKPFDMESTNAAVTASGSYQRIVDLTRKFKSSQQ